MIRAQELTKRYGPVLALDRASFSVAPGEVVGFFGPNGAGKSTLLKILSTWLPPTSGRAEVAGYDVEREPLAVRRALGYLPEHNPLYEGMRVDRFLDFVGRVRGLAGAHLAERFDWVVERCGLAAVVGRRIHRCSK
ncbi:MAG TPA: ATP-binding cassette domain-containing protein, partial [Thermoanaerobaculia bacterium]|nr:ATP-binding cassette domain-containing protein [Thermoanaerobaculia bacterium]